MITELEKQWREEFEEEYTKDFINSDFVESILRLDSSGEYSSAETYICWTWYLNGRKKADEEIQALRKRVEVLENGSL